MNNKTSPASVVEPISTVRAFAVFGPDGKAWIETIEHTAQGAWVTATEESRVKSAELKKDGYTCREVLITEATS